MAKKPSGPKTYDIHPAAELFPMMSETEYEGLKEDIRLHGLNDDVLIWDGKLLDGRNRLRACMELGIEPGFAELPTSLDPVAWVLSHNLHRRHLTTSQRAMVAEKLATLRAGDNQHGKEVGGIQPTSQDDAAKSLGVSRDSVKKARKVRANASKKVIAAVEAGEMSLNAAVATTKPQKPTTEDTPADDAFPEDETMAEICQRETSEIESWARKFGDLLKEAQKALAAVPTLDELNARDGWERKLKEALATLRGTKPVVCPICQGDGTDKCPCGGHGRVTKQQHGQMV